MMNLGLYAIKAHRDMMNLGLYAIKAHRADDIVVNGGKGLFSFTSVH